MSVTIEPVSGARWDDLCSLFGPNGANSGCWCMWWRISANEWTAAGNEANRAAFERVVTNGEPAGLLAYNDGIAVGWCAVAPRTAYPRILRSRVLRPADPGESSVWAVTCFFIHRKHRRSGVSGALLDEAVRYASRGGARIVEGYPVDTAGEKRPSGDLFTGTAGLFAAAGFTEFARAASGRRIVMRRVP